MRRAKKLQLVLSSKKSIPFIYLSFFASLQLEIYRSLGIEWLNTVSENSKKCRIRSAINNDVHTVEVTSDQELFTVTNRLWDFCSI